MMKKKQQVTFTIRLQVLTNATAIVLASTLKEAQEKVETGSWNGFEYEELVDWTALEYEEDFI